MQYVVRRNTHVSFLHNARFIPGPQILHNMQYIYRLGLDIHVRHTDVLYIYIHTYYSRMRGVRYLWSGGAISVPHLHIIPQLIRIYHILYTYAYATLTSNSQLGIGNPGLSSPHKMKS